MVSRFTLIFWRWVVTFHDRLHDARKEYGTWRGEPSYEAEVANITFTLPPNTTVTYGGND